VNTRDYDGATRADLLLGAEVWERPNRWELHRGDRVRLFASYNALLGYLDAVEDRRTSRCARRSPSTAVRKGVKP
jgi:hypothetical protein